MSGRGIDFLENWVKENVTEANRHGDLAHAKELRDLCVAEAAAWGITVDELEKEWGTVESVIYEAMQNDFEAELEFWKKFVAARDKNETRH